MVLGIYQNSPPFERSACFYVTLSESFKRFQYFKFETNFLENENLFQKTGILFEIEIEILTALNGDFKMDLSQRVEFC